MPSDDIILRRATNSDLNFLISVIIEADKSGTNKSAYCSLLGLNETELTDLFTRIFKHPLFGCEFSISTFCVALHNDQLIGACASWIEALDDIPSWQLRMLGIREEASPESYNRMLSKKDIVSSLMPERNPLSLQIESVFISPEYRGKGLFKKMIDFHLNEALKESPAVQSMEIIVYDNNMAAINSYKKAGFNIKNTTKLNHHDILLEFPSDGMVLLFKNV